MAMKSFPLSGKRANATSSGSTTICTFQIPSLQCSSISAAGGSHVTTCSVVSALPSPLTGSLKILTATCTLPPFLPIHHCMPRQQSTRAATFRVSRVTHLIREKLVPIWVQSCHTTPQTSWIGGGSGYARRWSATSRISTTTAKKMPALSSWLFCSRMPSICTTVIGKSTGC